MVLPEGPAVLCAWSESVGVSKKATARGASNRAYGFIFILLNRASRSKSNAVFLISAAASLVEGGRRVAYWAGTLMTVLTSVVDAVKASTLPFIVVTAATPGLETVIPG